MAEVVTSNGKGYQFTFRDIAIFLSLAGVILQAGYLVGVVNAHMEDKKIHEGADDHTARIRGEIALAERGTEMRLSNIEHTLEEIKRDIRALRDSE